MGIGLFGTEQRSENTLKISDVRRIFQRCSSGNGYKWIELGVHKKISRHNNGCSAAQLGAGYQCPSIQFNPQFWLKWLVSTLNHPQSQVTKIGVASV
jgi:hypothetical protein